MQEFLSIDGVMQGTRKSDWIFDQGHGTSLRELRDVARTDEGDVVLTYRRALE